MLSNHFQILNYENMLILSHLCESKPDIFGFKIIDQTSQTDLNGSL